MIRHIFTAVFMVLSTGAIAGNPPAENRVYHNNLKTVQLRAPGEMGSYPFLQLGRGQLELRFDDLNADMKNYQYTFLHCNADWTPSDLIKSEYLDNYQQEIIRNYDFSFNTFIPYTHYNLRFPNEYIQFTKSGNYLLIVYLDDPEEPAFTLRFVVWEDLVSITPRVHRANKAESMMEEQQVDFDVFHGNYPIPDPFRDLKVTVMQNQRWDNAITHLKPRFLSNSSLNYDYDGENNFPGGNEFREFDTKDMRNLSLRIRKIEIDTSFIAYVMPEESRQFRQYSTWEDLNGSYAVRKFDARDDHTEADYVIMDFLLSHPSQLPGGVYLFGEITNWLLDPEWALTYDPGQEAYVGRFLIKQGFYNYQYATMERNGQPGTTPLEGSHWQTENNYTILVYHREIGIRYDRVIGLGSANFWGN